MWSSRELFPAKTGRMSLDRLSPEVFESGTAPVL